MFIHPNPAPLTAFLSRVEDEPTTDPQFNWLEEQTPQQVVFASAAYAAGVTSIVVTTGTNLGQAVSDLVIFKPGHVILNQTSNEQMLVTAFDGVNTLTVARGFGTTAAAAIVSGDPLLIVGNSFAEGSGYATSIAYQPSAPFNQTGYLH